MAKNEVRGVMEGREKGRDGLAARDQDDWWNGREEEEIGKKRESVRLTRPRVLGGTGRYRIALAVDWDQSYVPPEDHDRITIFFLRSGKYT
eukprot:1231570-Amorphochlora_amoeboformis.AAC.1